MVGGIFGLAVLTSDIYIYCVCSKTYTHNMVVFFIVYYHSCTASSYCIVRLEMGI